MSIAMSKKTKPNNPADQGAKTRVAMVGVGKLGQACAEVMAMHYPTVGYDIHFRSPKNFEMVTSIGRAVACADIIFVAAPTPHDPK